MEIIAKSFNGIGDLLFLTPTLRVIKEAYPKVELVVNTNYPTLLWNNPFVDRIGSKNRGVFLGYADPIHCVNPTKHHIIADWEIVTKAYALKTKIPELQPEIHLPLPEPKFPKLQIGVQLNHKGHWHSKRVWPFFDELINQVNANDHAIRKIPTFPSIGALVRFIAGLSLVVCSEGGIQHIAKAVGTQAIVIYGGFAKPEWNGYEDQINMTNPKECSYCYNPHLCVNKIERACMKEITIPMVMEEIKNALH